MKATLVVMVVSALIVVLLAPQVPAPTTKDSREMILQTYGFGVGRDLDCRHFGLILYDAGVSLGATERRGQPCSAAEPMTTTTTITEPTGAAAPCAYADVVAWAGGVAVFLYGETNGQEGLQREGGAGARADQYCSLP